MISREECLELLKRHDLPDNIIQHSILVNKIAVFLAKELQKKGVEIYVDLVDSASLLHDIGRKRIIDNGGDHIAEGYEILQNESLISQAIVCRKHGMLSPLNPVTKPKEWEEKVVFYADKRAGEGRAISAKERVEDLKKRYPKDAKEIEKASAFLFKVEKEIFYVIEIKPEDLEKLIN